MNDQELLSYCDEWISYNPHTGIFTRKKPQNRWKKGTVMGGNHDGYIHLPIKGKYHLAHRLAFLIHHGYLPSYPEYEVEHKNRIRSDNRILNLRKATRSENSRNHPIPKTNTSGFKGAHWHKRTKKWGAKITFNYKQIHLGYFTCPIEAAKAYNKAALELHGEFAFLNPIP